MRGLGVPRNCDYAVQYFRAVAERGHWSGGLKLAHASYAAGRKMDACTYMNGKHIVLSPARFLVEGG